MRPIDGDALIENKFKNAISYNAFVNLVKRQPTIESDWTEMMVICDNCGHAIHVKRYRPEEDTQP